MPSIATLASVPPYLMKAGEGPHHTPQGRGRLRDSALPAQYRAATFKPQEQRIKKDCNLISYELVHLRHVWDENVVLYSGGRVREEMFCEKSGGMGERWLDIGAPACVDTVSNHTHTHAPYTAEFPISPLHTPLTFSSRSFSTSYRY